MNVSSIQLSSRHVLVRAGAALFGAALLGSAALTLGKSAAFEHAAASPIVITSAADAAEAPVLDPDLVPRYGDAVRLFRAHDHAGAYGRFAELADHGHAPSAQWALAMASQGPLLFGSEWSATEGQLRRWSALSAREAKERAVLIAEHDRGE